MSVAIDRQILFVNILCDAADRHVVVGPTVTHPNIPHPYFTVAGHDGKQFWIDLIELADRSDQELLFKALTANAEGYELHVMNDEIEMAELCHQLWPCTTTAKILASMKGLSEKPAAPNPNRQVIASRGLAGLERARQRT